MNRMHHGKREARDAAPFTSRQVKSLAGERHVCGDPCLVFWRRSFLRSASRLNPFEFFDFGVRRRFSAEWHREVLTILKREVPQFFKGASDVLFALDSIPAVFGVTQDPFIVYTSNIFAILGLRSLYFLLAGVIHKFVYLKTGLALILAGLYFIMISLPFQSIGDVFKKGGEYYDRVRDSVATGNLAIFFNVSALILILVSVAAITLLAAVGAYPSSIFSTVNADF